MANVHWSKLQNEEFNRWKQKLTEAIKTVVTPLPYIVYIYPLHTNVYLYIQTNIDIYKTPEQPLKSIDL